MDVRFLSLEQLFASVLTPLCLLSAFKAFQRSRRKARDEGTLLHVGLFALLPLHNLFLAATRRDSSVEAEDRISLFIHSLQTSYICGLSVLQAFPAPPVTLVLMLLAYPTLYLGLSPHCLELYFTLGTGLSVLGLLLTKVVRKKTSEEFPLGGYLIISALSSATAVIIARSSYRPQGSLGLLLNDSYYKALLCLCHLCYESPPL